MKYDSIFSSWTNTLEIVLIKYIFSANSHSHVLYLYVNVIAVLHVKRNICADALICNDMIPGKFRECHHIRIKRVKWLKPINLRNDTFNKSQ